MALCCGEKGQNCSKFVMRQEMHGASLSFMKDAIILMNTVVLILVLALSYRYAESSNKFDSLRNAALTRKSLDKNCCNSAAMLSKYRVPFRNYAGRCAFYFVYTYLLGLKNKRTVFSG